MASPFKLFRKYQKTAFVLLGVMAMVSFIVLPACLQYMGTSSVTNATFATWRYGKIDGVRLTNITREITDLASFYDRLDMEIQIQNQEQCRMLGYMSDQLRQIDEEQAVEEWVVAQYMRREGFDVSHEEVGDFISNLTWNRDMSKKLITEKIYKDVLKELNLSNDYVAYLVGNRMLLEQFAGMADMSVASSTPTEEFDWHNRFNLNMRAEAIPVAVSDFTSKVDAPTPKQLKAFFTEKRFHDLNPRALESGFALPMMVEGEYLSFDRSMLDTASVTDEEVQQYYEENKDLFVEQPFDSIPGMRTIPTPGAGGTLTFPGMEGTSTDVTVPTETTITIPLTAPTGDVTPDSQPATTEEPATEQPAIEIVPVETPATAEPTAPTEETEVTPATDVPAIDVPATDTPATDTPAADAPAESTEETDAAEVPEPVEPTSWNFRNVPIRLVSYQSESEENVDPQTVENVDAAENVGEIAPAEEDAPVVETAPAAEAVPAAETAPATDTPVITLQPGITTGGLPGLGSSLPNRGSVLGGSLSGSTPSLTSGGMTTPVPPPVTYRPLDDTLKAEIREMIATKRMEEKFKQVQDAINSYFAEYLKSQQLDNAPEVPLPDLASLAKTLGLRYVSFGKVDYHALIDNHYDFAASITADSRQLPVVQGIFIERGAIIEKKAYRSAESVATPYTLEKGNGTQYLFWITEIAEPRIPEFEEEGMAELVEARWREVQARPLARKKAEELAELAKKSEGLLLEYFTANPNDDVKSIVGTEFFTWMTYEYNPYYMVRPVFRQAEVRETGVLPQQALRDNVVLKNLGDDFMKAVYNLEPGEVTVTHNVAQDRFYVVRLTEATPDKEAAFDEFVTSSKGVGILYKQAAVDARTIAARQGAMKKVFDETKFVWKVKPSEYQEQERLKSQQRQRGQDEPGGNIPPNVPRF